MEYIHTFYKIKLESCGYPKWCHTEEDKQSYLDTVLEKEGIKLDPEKIEVNPGRKSVGKINLNCFWGLFLS